MGKTPSRSRKQIKPRAPYRRSKKTEAATPAPAPVRVALPQVPPITEVSPDPVPTPAPIAAAPAPVARPQPAPPPVEMPAPPTPVDIAITPPPAPVTTASEWSGLDGLAAVARASLGACQAVLTSLPHPSEIVAGDPSTPEPPPGLVPPGDSRSLRAGDQFALVYRHGPSLVTRIGTIGRRGEWRVVTYPNPARAASAYAAECSRLHLLGFTDLG